MSVSPSQAPKQNGKKTLSEIFNHFAADAVQRFPQLKGRLMVVDMNEGKAYGIENIDRRKTGLTERDAVDYISQMARRQLQNGEEGSFSTYDPDWNVNVIFIDKSMFKSEFNNVSAATEERLLATMDHELGHQGVQYGSASIANPNDPYSTLLAESIADAYSAIRHYQRYGINNDLTHGLETPSGRAFGLMFGGDIGHFTSLMLDAIAENKSSIDYSKLDAKQTADLAQQFAAQYLPSRQYIVSMYREFEDVRDAFAQGTSYGVKSLIEKTLDPQNDYSTFKFGSLWLKGLLEDRTFPNGKPIGLPKSYLDTAAADIKAREQEFAQAAAAAAPEARHSAPRRRYAVGY